MRVAPLALAYRNAPLPVLEAALRESLMPTQHVHPEAVEGALAQALAVAHLSKLQPTAQDAATAQGGAAGAPPEEAMGLLEALQQLLQGRPKGVMHSKLQRLKEGLSQVGTVSMLGNNEGAGWRFGREGGLGRVQCD